MPHVSHRPADAQSRSLQLLEYVPYQIGQLSSRVRTMLSQRALEQRQLSVAEWRCLVFVGEANFCSARDIVNNSDMDHVVVHRAVVRLEERDFLYRIEDPGNRRLKLLRLSANGARVLEEIIPVAYEIQDELLSLLSAEDQATLRRILAELMERFGAAQGKAPVGRRSETA